VTGVGVTKSPQPSKAEDSPGSSPSLPEPITPSRARPQEAAVSDENVQEPVESDAVDPIFPGCCDDCDAIQAVSVQEGLLHVTVGLVVPRPGLACHRRHPYLRAG
jgi:hypothetical protein